MAMALATAAATVGNGEAAESPPVNAVGIWKLGAAPKSPGAFQQTLKIKQERGKLTGTLSHKTGGRVEYRVIEDAKLEGAQLSFTVNVAPISGNGPGAKLTYRGKISGDEIKGKYDLEFGGETHARDWEAKRVQAE